MKQVTAKPVFKEGPPGYAFKNGKLYDFNKRYILVLRPWPDPRSWLKRRSHDWKSNRRFADQFLTGNLFAAGAENELPRRELPPPMNEYTAALRNTEEWQARQKKGEEIRLRYRRIMAQYFDHIPPVVRSELLRYPGRKWHLLNVFARCPGAVDLSRSNPALLYALASNWVFHKPAVKSPMRAARSLVCRKQRDILKWLHFPPREPVRRILSRVAPESLSVVTLLTLRKALRRKTVVKTLAHIRRINTGVIRLVNRDEYRELLTPRLLNDVGQDREQDGQIPPILTILSDALQMMRYGDDPAKQPKAFVSLRQLKAAHDRRARQEAAAYVTNSNLSSVPVQLPPPPFAGTETILPIQTIGDLYREGEEMHHCAFSYAERIVKGSEYVYRVVAPVRATLSIQNHGKIWTPGQLVEVCNKPVAAEIRQQVFRDLLRSPRTTVAMPEDDYEDPIVTMVSGVGPDLEVGAPEEDQANSGDPIAQTRLAERFWHGYGVQRDVQQAIEWFHCAAEQGYSRAQNTLGWLYAQGADVQQDDAEALKWYRLAAENGDAMGQFNLGWMLENGRGCPSDKMAAIAWYEKAASAGSASGQFHYDRLQSDAPGKPQDQTPATWWIGMTAEMEVGDAEAQCNEGPPRVRSQ